MGETDPGGRLADQRKILIREKTSVCYRQELPVAKKSKAVIIKKILISIKMHSLCIDMQTEE